MLRVLSFAFLLIFSANSLMAKTPSFEGTWESTFGTLQLFVDGERVQGTYLVSGELAAIEGKLKGRYLDFKYKEKAVSGEGKFELAPHGQSFSGRWRQKGETKWSKWSGTRTAVKPKKPSVNGLWKSTFGRMRLQQRKDKVRGIYSLEGASFIDGAMQGRRLEFSYLEDEVQGEGWFQLSADGKALHGRWRPNGGSKWNSWNAVRQESLSDVKWLVVVEAPWQGGLAEREYSFGTMLKAYFAGSESVRVRHRFFTDARSLQRWCREAAYLAEPVILCIATHGTTKGLEVNGQVIGPKSVALSLDYDDELLLLHFSACKLMKSDFVSKMRALLDSGLSFPVSGYTTAVDWAGSAIVEFLYFELILVRGLSPAKAFAQVQKMLTFAGEKGPAGAAIEPLGFAFEEADRN